MPDDTPKRPRILVTAPNPNLNQQSAQSQTSTVQPNGARVLSAEKVLVKYAQNHLQLMEAEEEVARLRNLVQQFEAHLKKISAEHELTLGHVADQEATIKSLQEKLDRYVGPTNIPDNPETTGLGPEAQETDVARA